MIDRLHDPSRHDFASDNYAGIHPAVLEAIAEANSGHQAAYGGDVYTDRLRTVIQQQFGPSAEVFPVFNGTGANVLSLAASIPRWGAVIASAHAHIQNDEGGAPEKIGGIKIYPVSSTNGKLSPSALTREAWGFDNEHRAQPAAVSITQSTEVGTVYQPDEVQAIADFAHEHRMLLHMDGARLWNAAAALGCSFREFISDAGVDVLSLGGTKNGALAVEAVVVLRPDRIPGLLHLRKSSMQLASKMRFFSAQLLALFRDDLGLTLATHANAMARRLRQCIEGAPGLELTQPTEANAVFARLPAGAADQIRKHYHFYDWNHGEREVRWMCAFDTTPEDVDRFGAVIWDALTNINLR